MQPNFKRVKFACYTANVTMSIIGNLSPLLFITFRSLYGISYSLLGLLVLVNFFTQLSIDLIFSFFSHKFNIPKVVKFMPLLTIFGLLIYAIAPFFCPKDFVYIALLIGTVFFSASSGLAEVLISPVIAAIPAENPDHEMSKLHSVYAWGVVAFVLFGTLFLLIFGQQSWQWLTLILIAVPLVAFFAFSGSELPKMQTPERFSGAIQFLKRKELWLCVIAIFLGGASECTMAQWCSGYLEQAIGIPKIWGDIFGMALFSLALGLGRSLYAKFGKNVEKILFLGAIGATVCYLTAALSGVAILGLNACALTGFCVSMLWPGSLIAASDRIPDGGVFLYAMMAAGGDLGASVGPQLVGVVTDAVSANAAFADLAQTIGLSAEQLGMKAGMLVGTVFPLLAILVYFLVLKGKRNTQAQ
ncbi:MAG: MFS transporter [Clostridia bacterium]|nr:MFS transporter [Clostridia bacterium]